MWDVIVFIPDYCLSIYFEFALIMLISSMYAKRERQRETER